MRARDNNKRAARAVAFKQHRSLRSRKSYLLTITVVDICMRDRGLVDKTRPVIPRYQEGKNADGESYEKESRETSQTRIRN